MNWEIIDQHSQRARVKGGWLVWCRVELEGEKFASMAFVPDPMHGWSI